MYQPGALFFNRRMEFLVSLKNFLELAIVLIAVVAIVTSQQLLLIPLVYIGAWRFVLSEAFARLDPLKGKA